jgi:NhaC family Na+:H+ antiporter
VLFIVPLIVVFMIFKKTPPLIALFVGTVLGGIFAVIFQSSVINSISGYTEMTFNSAYQTVLNSMTTETSIDSGNSVLNDLFNSGGMKGMLNTIWLVICAMVFGGIMESIGALEKISSSLLKLGKSTFSIFASTVGSCLAINLTASDQYLSIVIPGKMFSKAFKDKSLAPENLSRTLEDSGTVTSVLIPWNTCGAYQSGILGVSVFDYFIYAIFNWLSPFMTLIVAAFSIKIKKLK